MTAPTVQQKATLWLALVFVLGTALGAVLGYAFAHRSYAAVAPALTRRANKSPGLAKRNMSDEPGFGAAGCR